MGNREKLEKDFRGLVLFAGLVGVVFCGPGLLLSLLPGFHDTLLGNDPLTRLGLSWMYLTVFGGLFLGSLVAVILGIRGLTRPPSLLYRLTHPRLPHRALRGRGTWRLS